MKLGWGLRLTLAFLACGCDDGADGVGKSCWESLTPPEGGFQDSEIYLQVGSSCESDYCVVNHYEGDLVLDPDQGDGVEDELESCGEGCGWDSIEDRIYCTCKCGVSAGGDPDSIACDCPEGFECCPTMSIGAAAGDYCVRRGTCR